MHTLRAERDRTISVCCDTIPIGDGAGIEGAGGSFFHLTKTVGITATQAFAIVAGSQLSTAG